MPKKTIKKPKKTTIKPTIKAKIKKLSKKRRYLIAVAIIGVVSLIGSVLIIQQIGFDFNWSKQDSSNSADSLKLQAIKIMHSNEQSARDLLVKALAKYQTAGDTNNIVDVQSVIYLIDHNQ